MLRHVKTSFDMIVTSYQIVSEYLKVFKGAFTYDIRFLGRQAGQAASDFTKEVYVVNHLIKVGKQVGQKYPKNI